MKLKLYGIGLALLLLGSVSYGQEAPVNPKIWSIHYWQQLAGQGLIPVAAPAEVAPPVYTGSVLNGELVLTDDSPDVLTTNDPNTSQSENSIFVNPLDNLKVLNSNNSTDRPPVGVLYGTSGLLTSDGGLTWGGTIQGTGGSNSGDPAAVIDLNGTYFVGYISNPGGQGVARSTNDGLTWTPITVAPNPGSLADKNHLWVDNSPTSPYAGNLYAAWTDFGGSFNNQIVVSRSTDNGFTWSARVNVSAAVAAGSHNQGVNVTTGPNGEVYVAWAIYDGFPADETAIGFTKSTDGGVTWEPARRIVTNIRGIRNTGVSKNHRVNSFPVITADISDGDFSGNLYVVWTNVGVPGINQGPDIDVYMSRSTDNGATWETPVRINQDPSGLGKQHYFPWITCDPETGGLSVIYYDDRNVAANQCETFVSNSIDGGSTWEDLKISDVAFTPAPISGLAGGYFGDYLGITARGGLVYPVWTDNRTGVALSYTSPYLLLDPEAPREPLNFRVYSDYQTPTEMLLTWEDPTNLQLGDTLLPGDFQVIIIRDSVAIDSVPGGTQAYTDMNLVDGQEYHYSIFAKTIVTQKPGPDADASWFAGGSPVPNPVQTFDVGGNQSQVSITWTSPTQNIDGTPMDDYAGVNLYQNGALVATFSRSSSDTGMVDSDVYSPSSAGFYDWYVTVIDNETPLNESAPSDTFGTPLNVPIVENFDVAGDPNPGLWINTTTEVNDRAVNPPQGPYALNLNGQPDGPETLDLKPLDLSGFQGTGITLFFQYQPQGNGNAPEESDSLQLYFKNDLGDWVLVWTVPGGPLEPFQTETIDIEGAPNGGGTFFHGQFQLRFRNLGGSSNLPNDDWFVDELLLDLPVGIADEASLPDQFQVSSNYPNPFNPSTTIRYQLPVQSEVSLVVYNMLGQKIRTILSGKVAAGQHLAKWDGRNSTGQQVASGVYFYTFQATPVAAASQQPFKAVYKMILMK